VILRLDGTSDWLRSKAAILKEVDSEGLSVLGDNGSVYPTPTTEPVELKKVPTTVKVLAACEPVFWMLPLTT